MEYFLLWRQADSFPGCRAPGHPCSREWRSIVQPTVNRSPSLVVLLLVMLAVAALSMGLPTLVQLVVSAGSAMMGAFGWNLALLLIPAGVLIAIMLVALTASRRQDPDSRQGEQTSNLPPPNKVVANPHFKTITADRPTTRYSDVAGVEAAKEELAEVVDFLRSPGKFASVGARVPRGALLVGPPGTGKTLLARAVAGEAGVPFISSSGSEFVELYVGVGASRVRSLFQEARKHAPCIMFIDEIDAVGRRRGGNFGMSHEEREQTLNQILVEMDGFDPRTNVIVLAATNRADVLDPALLRPGRFDRQVMLDLPDAVGRLAILRVHARAKPLSGSVDLTHIARQTAGLSGADLENLINEAAILAARHERLQIVPEDLEEAMDRVTAGPRRKSRLLTEREKRITAHHEIGHALVAFALPHADQVTKVSIVSRGMAGGYTRLVPEQDRNMWSQSEFEAAIAAALGGHVAEELIFAEVTTGPSNDLQRATEMARRMVTEFGMSKEIGPLSFASHGGYVGDGVDSRLFGDELARQIDAEVRRVVSQAHQRAREILETNREVLVAAAAQLLEQETLEPDDLEHLFGPVRRASGAQHVRTASKGDLPPAPADLAQVAASERRSVLTLIRRRRREGPPVRRPALASERRSAW
ncbi:MAG: ATP-dependent zinc metalloprotease FtsH [Chloroflexi bacterium]|nr:ATP-dependent zinc metalloprotease FtsH [Chloroflexota bacterium]